MAEQTGMNEAQRQEVDATIAKLIAETQKLQQEETFYAKRNRWFEFTMGVAFTLATGAILRIFY